MQGPSHRLKRLEQELLALGEETMLIEELDGFIAGLLVCPDLIRPSEWLPIVWGGDGDDQTPAFDNLKHANRVLGLVMDHYNGVARTLMEHADRYSPLLPVDERNGDILWEIWVEGFAKARQATPSSLAKAARRRCRYGSGDARNAGACRSRVHRSAQGAPRQAPDRYRARQYCTMDCPARCMAARQPPADPGRRPRAATLFRFRAENRPQRSLPLRLRKEI
jgi:yecA family protein